MVMPGFIVYLWWPRFGMQEVSRIVNVSENMLVKTLARGNDVISWS